jgi:hypothetical protein
VWRRIWWLRSSHRAVTNNLLHKSNIDTFDPVVIRPNYTLRFFDKCSESVLDFFRLGTINPVTDVPDHFLIDVAADEHMPISINRLLHELTGLAIRVVKHKNPDVRIVNVHLGVKYTPFRLPLVIRNVDVRHSLEVPVGIFVGSTEVSERIRL